MASSSSTVYIANQPPLSRKARPCHSRHGLLVVTPPQRAPAAASPTLRSSRPPPEPARSSCLATMWRKIQGADDWAGLVEPLHPVLRDEVIRYGELVMACYKAFDVNPRSPRYLACRFGKGRLLKEVGLGAAGYEITRYVYATPPDVGSIIPVPGAARRGRWIGYVAVSSDSEVRRLGRRDVLVAFRGTVTNAEWAANLMSSLTPASFDPHDPRPGVEVESGFLSLYTSSDGAAKFGHGSCREQLLKEVSRLISKHKEEEMSVTVAGHSMGSALAVLFGYDLSELGLNRFRLRREVPVTVYSFGGPRVGNAGFKERCEELGLKVLRVANVHDPVTKLPGLFMNENVLELLLPWRCSCYVHLGVELALDFFKVQNPACAHDLETYIGLLKCPGKMVQVHKEGVLGLLEKARMILLKKKKMMMMMMMMKRRFQGWAWPDAALRHVGNWVQSLRLI